MLDRIENLRRLKEQCERRARSCRVKQQHGFADYLDRQANSLGWEIDNLCAREYLAAFATRVEPDAQDQYRLECRPGGFRGFVRGG